MSPGAPVTGRPGITGSEYARPPHSWRGSVYVAEHRLRDIWKWKRSIIAESIGNPILYLTAIGIGVGGLVSAGPGQDELGGVSYLVFLAPALMAAAAMQGAMTEVMFPTLSGFLWDKGFTAMRATSLTGGQIANGVLLAAVVRVAFTCVAYWLALRAFGAVDWASALTLIPVAIMAGACWGAFMLAVTCHAKSDDVLISISMRLVIMPIFLFSGTFYPLSTLPWSIQWIGWLSPLWYATELGRWASYGMPLPGWQAVLGIAYLGTLGLVSHLIARRTFERRLTS